MALLYRFRSHSCQGVPVSDLILALARGWAVGAAAASASRAPLMGVFQLFSSTTDSEPKLTESPMGPQSSPPTQTLRLAVLQQIGSGKRALADPPFPAPRPNLPRSRAANGLLPALDWGDTPSLCCSVQEISGTEGQQPQSTTKAKPRLGDWGTRASSPGVRSGRLIPGVGGDRVSQ